MSSRWIFNQLQGRGAAHLVHGCMGRLHERGFAHAARAPEQDIIGRQPARETKCILDKLIAIAVNPYQQRQGDPVDLGHRLQPAMRMPDEGIGAAGFDGVRRGRGDALQRLSDADKERARLES